MRRLKAVVFVLFCFVFISNSFGVSAEEIASEKNGLDVTFVMDYSGSMAANDPDHTAIGMVKAFVDTVHSADIRIGFVAYNDHIMSSAAPVSVRTQEERDSLKALMDSTGYSGNTDIGLGLSYAYGLTGQESGRKRMIVLISDGESDLNGSSTGRTLESSNLDLKNTVEACQSQGIPVYTVAFGKYDGNKDVLKEISGQTNARNYTVEKPETLIEVLYGIFNSNMAYRIQEITNSIYAEGSQSIRIKLDDSYLDEMDVLMISAQQIGDTTVFYGDQQIKPVNLVHYSVAKISEVKNDIKELTIQTNTLKNQELKIYLISYRGLIPVMEIETAAGRNQPLPYRIYFKDKNGTVITDETFYKNFTPKMEIYADGQAENGRKSLETAIEGGVIAGQVVLPQSGTYYIDSRLDDVMESCVFETARIQVINTPPAGELPDQVRYNPFSKEKQFVLDDYFTDFDGDPLLYTLDQDAGDLAEIGLEGGVLTIKPLKSGNGNILLKISDGEAAISYTYSITVMPLWKAYWWVIVLVLAALGAALWRIFHKPKPELEVITEKKASNRFQGKMDAYFISQPEGEDEIPPLTFPMYKIKDNRVSLGDLMKEYPNASAALGLDGIFLIADEDRRMILYHSSDSSIMIGSSIVCRKIQYSVSFGDIISITSPDGAYDLEVHYISMLQ
ncbi:vWA domain-containing protein [Clostridium sp. Marseille-P2415]|uniref:vWA domain-containing protein n=1 Tax=Clostridium sp. Marseille-P2415 TaxID=1805471 RepID=UPI000988896A|nr:vWA domain-containing protein [Clostridium sp. Marseille-P2415]